MTTVPVQDASGVWCGGNAGGTQASGTRRGSGGEQGPGWVLLTGRGRRGRAVSRGAPDRLCGDWSAGLRGRVAQVEKEAGLGPEAGPRRVGGRRPLRRGP